MLRVPQNTTAVTTPVATGGGFFVSGCLSYYFLAFCILCTNDVAVLFLQLVLCHISYGKVLRVFPYIHPDMFFLLRFFVFFNNNNVSCEFNRSADRSSDTHLCKLREPFARFPLFPY